MNFSKQLNSEIQNLCIHENQCDKQFLERYLILCKYSEPHLTSPPQIYQPLTLSLIFTMMAAKW